MSESPNQAEVLIVGGGLIGLCSAHYLHEAGYRVRVLERREAVGLETSFANSGMVTPSMSDPWNAPGVHRTILKYLGRAEAPMLLRPGAIGHYLGWGLKFLRHSAPARFEPAMRANFKLSAYSLQQLKALRASLGLEYEQRIAGTMKVFRDQAGMDQALADCEKLQQFGLRYRLLDRAAALVDALQKAGADEADVLVVRGTSLACRSAWVKWKRLSSPKRRMWAYARSSKPKTAISKQLLPPPGWRDRCSMK